MKEKIRTENSFQQEPLRILHVDDDASFLRVSKLILEIENNKFEIDTATSVDEASSKLETQPFDAIVCDYEMPIKDGLDFLKELREQKNNIAFIIFTGKGREEVAIKALNLGADHYINKTGSPEAVYSELADAIRKIVKGKKEASPTTLK
jgi:DNA-binding response OmpR family regulator